MGHGIRDEENNPWPPIKITSFTTPVCIHVKQLQTKEATTAAIAKRSVGKIQHIPDVTKSIELKSIEQIFEPIDSKYPKSILISGHPGIGKTTLVKEVCIQWAKDKLLKSTQLVLLLHLSDPNVQKITNELQLIQYFVTSSSASSKIKIIQRYLEDKQGAGVTLIIDGFDGLGDIDLSQESFFTGLIKMRILKKARIVITSCPSVSICLHQMVDKRIEILGFGKSSKEHFINENLKDYPDKKKRLQQHLQLYPSIKAVCYLPLIFSIMVFLCIQGDLPDTMTKMYTQFIMHMICRHLKKKGIMKVEENITSMEDFPKPVCNVLKMLGGVAYNGLLDNRTHFEEKDLPDHEMCKSDPTCFGLLQATKCYSAQTIGTPVLIFSFYHEHLQKYFAAKHFMSLPVNEAYDLITKYFFSKCGSADTDSSSDSADTDSSSDDIISNEDVSSVDDDNNNDDDDDDDDDNDNDDDDDDDDDNDDDDDDNDDDDDDDDNDDVDEDDNNNDDDDDDDDNDDDDDDDDDNDDDDDDDDDNDDVDEDDNNNDEEEEDDDDEDEDDDDDDDKEDDDDEDNVNNEDKDDDNNSNNDEEDDDDDGQDDTHNSEANSDDMSTCLSDMWLFLFGLTKGDFYPLLHYLSIYSSDDNDDER